jgi:hypothetical protein
MLDNPTTEAPWCALCGQSHAWGTSCDPQRTDELRRRVAKMADDHAAFGIYHTANTTFVRLATAYLAQENQHDG